MASATEVVESVCPPCGKGRRHTILYSTKDFTSCSYQQENATATLHFGSRNTSVAVNTSFVWRHYHNLQSFGIYGWRVHGMAISSVTLLAAAGMGIRCDFCAGTFGVHGSSLKLV